MEVLRGGKGLNHIQANSSPQRVNFSWASPRTNYAHHPQSKISSSSNSSSSSSACRYRTLRTLRPAPLSLRVQACCNNVLEETTYARQIGRSRRHQTPARGGIPRGRTREGQHRQQRQRRRRQSQIAAGDVFRSQEQPFVRRVHPAPLGPPLQRQGHCQLSPEGSLRRGQISLPGPRHQRTDTVSSPLSRLTTSCDATHHSPLTFFFRCSTSRLTMSKGTAPSGESEVYFSLLSVEEATRLQGLDAPSKMVYQVVEASGNKGIWTVDVRNQTNIPQTTLTKIFKVRALSSHLCHKMILFDVLFWPLMYW